MDWAEEMPLDQELEGVSHLTSGPTSEKTEVDVSTDDGDAEVEQGVSKHSTSVEKQGRGSLTLTTHRGVSQSEGPAINQKGVSQSERSTTTQRGVSQSESSTMTRGGVYQPVVSMSREEQYKYFEILVELKKWLEKGPLDGSINKGKSLVRRIRKHLMIPGVEEKF